MVKLFIISCRETLYLVVSVCLSVCTLVCLSVWLSYIFVPNFVANLCPRFLNESLHLLLDSGLYIQPLIQIYILYVRSLLEYCSVVWHSTLTGDQSHDLERVQKLCFKIIFGDKNWGYDLDKTGLERLSIRREEKCLKFGLKSLLHPVHSRMFPVNPQVLTNSSEEGRSGEHFMVNFA